MQINIVIGNPPYNNDMYIPFVEMGHQLASDCSVSITPAKWQAKGGKQNEAFRQNIVPYMSKIVYYPDCTEVFDIDVPDGIAYYFIQKGTVSKEKDIVNICDKQDIFNNNQRRTIEFTLNNVMNQIVKKVMAITDSIIKVSTDRAFWFRANTQYSKTRTDNSVDVYGGDKNGEKLLYGYYPKENISKNIEYISKYKAIIQFKQGNGYFTLDNTGKTLGLKPINIYNPNEVCKDDYLVIHTFNSLTEAESFKSYMDTRFIRFLVYSACVGENASNEETWRFVPDPVVFDHIFTDEELYKKYNLTEEEINIIESVIKERK